MRLGGLDQYVTIHSKDRSNPVLLVVHGGPGDVQSPFRAEYAAYEDHFTLVQWDQRGAGKTFGRHRDSTVEVTLERIVADGLELAEHLIRESGQQKIYVLGHSWGSVVAAGMVQQRPELFVAYIGTGQVGSWDGGVRYQRDVVLRRAREDGNREALDTIGALENFDPTNVRHFLTVSRFLRGYLGAADREWLSSIRERTSRSTTPADIDDIVGGMNLSGRSLFPDQIREDLFASAHTFSLPVHIIQGEEDLFTPTPVAIDYFNTITAPAKRLHVIEGGGHFALLTHQREFLDILLSIVGE